jgi:ketosteroid isomerase-like protein
MSADTSRGVAQANVALLQRLLDAFNTHDFDAMRAALHPDIVFEFPYIIEPFPRTVNGLEAVMTFMVQVSDFFESENLSNISIHAFADDPYELTAEFESDMQLKNQREYRNEYVVRAAVQDNKIIMFREYVDPVRLLVAMGGSINLPPPDPA